MPKDIGFYSNNTAVDYAPTAKENADAAALSEAAALASEVAASASEVAAEAAADSIIELSVVYVALSTGETPYVEFDEPTSTLTFYIAGGADGADGADGSDGADGDDGATGPQGEQGLTGDNGTNGTNGQDGDDGISISSSSYNAGNGKITINYADGTSLTTSDLRGQDGADGGEDSATAMAIALG
jgi:hypothetical protein